MKRTAIHKLSQWEKSDRIMMEDFNSDNARLEAALTAQGKSLENKANQADLREEISARKKADAEEANLRANAVSALNAAIAKLGNCQVFCAAYTATADQPNPKSFTFPHRPKLILVSHSGNKQFWAIAGMTFFFAGNYESYHIEWSGNTVSWYSDNTNMDLPGQPYLVLALLDAEE